MPVHAPTGSRRRPHEPQITTIVFLVVMLTVAAIATGGYLAQRDTADATSRMTMQPEAPVSGVGAVPGEEDEAKWANLATDGDWPGAPEVSAQAVFAFDPATGEVLFAKGASDEREIGSTVKIVTALVVIDHVPLDAEITIVEDDLVDPLMYSNMQLVAGDTLTVEQLLYGLLIPSGSDGARALARYTGYLIDPATDTPREVFADEMNRKAASLGMNHTHFANADGNDAVDSHSSARDIAVAAATLMEHPVLAMIAGETDYAFTSVGPEARAYSGVTTNQLLQEGHAGVIGVKTGSTESAGGCVVLAVERASGGTVIVAVLGSDLTYENGWIAVDARWGDARALLEFLGT